MSGKPLIKDTDSQNENNTKHEKSKTNKGICYTIRMATSLEDIRSLIFWKAIFAEFLGTLLLVLIGTGSCIQDWQSDHLDIVQIALSFGLTVATIVWIIGHISGGHINPAVTCAMLITRKISIIRAMLFLVAQLVGAIVGSALLKEFTPEEMRGPLGATTLAKDVTEAMAVGIEFFITFALVLTVFASCDSKRTDIKGSFPLSIGLSITMAHLWAVEYTGSSMNTARSFGPAVVMNIWKSHWVYWVGPLCGGMIAGLLYDNFLASNASLRKARDLLMASEFDDDKYPALKPKIRILEEVDEEEGEKMTV